VAFFGAFSELCGIPHRQASHASSTFELLLVDKCLKMNIAKRPVNDAGFQRSKSIGISGKSRSSQRTRHGSIHDKSGPRLWPGIALSVAFAYDDYPAECCGGYDWHPVPCDETRVRTVGD
jgi:hypothetical protein